MNKRAFVSQVKPGSLLRHIDDFGPFTRDKLYFVGNSNEVLYVLDDDNNLFDLKIDLIIYRDANNNLIPEMNHYNAFYLEDINDYEL